MLLNERRYRSFKGASEPLLMNGETATNHAVNSLITNQVSQAPKMSEAAKGRLKTFCCRLLFSL